MAVPRLKDFPYQGYFFYFVTVCCSNRQPYFQSADIVSLMLGPLKSLSQAYGFQVWTYCFMPDHLHLLLQGERKSADLRKLIAMFKQKTAFGFRKKYGEKLWQNGFHEHVLRKNEAIRTVSRYILDNPVRTGLVDYFWDYPHSGSMVFEVRKFFG